MIQLPIGDKDANVELELRGGYQIFDGTYQAGDWRYSIIARPRICIKYFLSFPQKNLSQEKTETN